MTHTMQSSSTPSNINYPLLVKRMAIGAAIGLVLILLFLLPIPKENVNPIWHKTWWVRPVVFVPLGGAAAGVVSYLLEGMRRRGGGMAVLAVLLSLVVLSVALFMSFVLGLAGTYWD